MIRILEDAEPKIYRDDIRTALDSARRQLANKQLANDDIDIFELDAFNSAECAGFGLNWKAKGTKSYEDSKEFYDNFTLALELVKNLNTSFQGKKIYYGEALNKNYTENYAYNKFLDDEYEPEESEYSDLGVDTRTGRKWGVPSDFEGEDDEWDLDNNCPADSFYDSYTESKQVDDYITLEDFTYYLFKEIHESYNVDIDDLQMNEDVYPERVEFSFNVYTRSYRIAQMVLEDVTKFVKARDYDTWRSDAVECVHYSSDGYPYDEDYYNISVSAPLTALTHNI